MAWAAFGTTAVSFGLWYKYFRYGTSLATFEGLQILAGFGMGLATQPPLLGMQAAMPLKEVGSMTTAFIIVRPAGAAIGQFCTLI